MAFLHCCRTRHRFRVLPAADIMSSCCIAASEAAAGADNSVRTCGRSGGGAAEQGAVCAAAGAHCAAQPVRPGACPFLFGSPTRIKAGCRQLRALHTLHTTAAAAAAAAHHEILSSIARIIGPIAARCSAGRRCYKGRPNRQQPGDLRFRRGHKRGLQADAHDLQHLMTRAAAARRSGLGRRRRRRQHRDIGRRQRHELIRGVV